MPPAPPAPRRPRPTRGAAAPRFGGAAVLAASILVGAVAVSPSPAGAAASDHPVTGRVSVTASGSPFAGPAATPAISGDGRWVAYLSKGAGPITGFAPSHLNVYRVDRATGTSVLVSVPAAGAGAQIDGDAANPQISDDGRYVSFEAKATNLVAGDTNAQTDVFRRDLALGTTQLISWAPGGAVGNADSALPSMSGDGSRIAFESMATNLVASGDANGQYDTFVWSSPGQVVRLANTSGGTASNGSTIYPDISADGTTVAYQSSSSNLPVAGTGSGSYDIYVQSAAGGAITRVDVAVGPGGPNSPGYVPHISGDGTEVLFDSKASNLVAGDTNGERDAFLRDVAAGTTTRISTNAFGLQLAQGGNGIGLSADGTVAAFRSAEDVANLPNPGKQAHLYVRSSNGAVEAVDLRNADGGLGSTAGYTVALSATGRFAAFDSEAGDLVRNDTNKVGDVFVRDRQATSAPFSSWNALVQQQLADFTGKPAVPAVAAEQAARLANGETTVGRFLVDLAHDPAWSAKRGPVIRLYWSFFLRAPDKGGLAYWLAKSEGGMTLPTMAAKFAASSEFQNTYGKLTNTGFVHLVYGNVLHRKADAAGVAHWVGKLEGGLSRGGMMTQFSESSEGKRVMSPYVDVLLLHLGLLRSLPTTGAFGSETLAVINGTAPISQVADDLRLSPAYATRIAH